MKPVSPLFLALALTVAPLPALANGAVAVGQSGNSVALGVAEDHPTTAVARDRAMQICQTARTATEAARANCTVVQDFNHGCVSVYADKRPGTPGFGWGYASTPLRAKWDALYACRDTAGPGGRCDLVGTSCD